MNRELQTSGFETVAEEIKQIFVEAEFASRWILIEAHHRVGQLILSLPGKLSENTQDLAQETGRSIRLLQYAVKFAQAYKTVDDLPEGKNISWNKVIREHLTTPKEKEEHEHSWVTYCSGCKVRKENEV